MDRYVARILENKWAFVAYTGSESRANTSRWFFVKPDKWALLRHSLEAFGADALEGEAQDKGHTSFGARGPNNTMIRAFEAFKMQRLYKDQTQFPKVLIDLLSGSGNLGEPVLGTSYIMPNTFLYLVRSTIPLGGKPYVPLASKLGYNMLLQAIETNETLERQRKALQDEQQSLVHAADATTRYQQLELFNVKVSHEYLVPPNDYLCSGCQRFGHHYKEACFLWPQEDAKPGFQFGANKFQGAKTMRPEDATHYGLLHKRLKS